MAQRMSDVIVVDYLRRIGSGELSEGSALPAESSMRASYEVSRSVVREAIRTLAAKGFVVASKGSATVVAPRRMWNVLDPEFLSVNTGKDFFGYLQEARELIEPLVAGLAAGRLDADEITRLEELQSRIEVTLDPEEHATLDLTFHQTIATATGNPVVASILALISGLGFRTRELSAHTPGGIERASAWHRRILAALRDGDAAAVESEMRGHMQQVREELERLGVAGSR
jgi:DNA-binding FadR family transcriptional regulator